MRAESFGGFILAIFVSAAQSIAGQGTRAHPSAALHEQVQPVPYTAQFTVTTERTLADGTKITHEDTEVQAVNSQGWRLTAITRQPLSSDQQPITHTTLFEANEGITLSWTVPDARAIATSMSLRPMDTACGSSSATAQAGILHAPFQTPRTRPAVEELGTETIQGVEAHGTRTTTTIPAGAMGNDQPMVRTAELWRAVDPGLHRLIVRSIIDDPMQGYSDRELVSFEQGDPDESQFEIPQGYQVVDRSAQNVGCTNSIPSAQHPSGDSTNQPGTSTDSSQ